MKPAVGRIVHYVRQGETRCRAAIVTARNNPELIDVLVFDTAGVTCALRRQQDERTKRGGTWHWPEGDQGPPMAEECY